MRYHVQMMINGKWDVMNVANTPRMADMYAYALRKSYAKFNPNVRIIDTDTNEEVTEIA